MAALKPEQKGNIKLDDNVQVTNTEINVPPHKYNAAECDQTWTILHEADVVDTLIFQIREGTCVFNVPERTKRDFCRTCTVPLEPLSDRRSFSRRRL